MLGEHIVKMSADDEKLLAEQAQLKEDQRDPHIIVEDLEEVMCHMHSAIKEDWSKDIFIAIMRKLNEERVKDSETIREYRWYYYRLEIIQVVARLSIRINQLIKSYEDRNIIAAIMDTFNFVDIRSSGDVESKLEELLNSVQAAIDIFKNHTEE